MPGLELLRFQWLVETIRLLVIVGFYGFFMVFHVSLYLSTSTVWYRGPLILTIPLIHHACTFPRSSLLGSHRGRSLTTPRGEHRWGQTSLAELLNRFAIVYIVHPKMALIALGCIWFWFGQICKVLQSVASYFEKNTVLLCSIKVLLWSIVAL
jgi:hypothetical protein